MSEDFKRSAQHFLELASSGKVNEAYEMYVSEGFIHHNPYFKGDRESLKQAMIDAHEQSPNLSFEVKQCIQEGDRVMTFSKVSKANMEIAVMHMARFEGSKIAELWDLGQIINPESPNENGIF
jgi:predicted SnoaL-like aldol condensation-catalyzing enzyme